MMGSGFLLPLILEGNYLKIDLTLIILKAVSDFLQAYKRSVTYLENYSTQSTLI